MQQHEHKSNYSPSVLQKLSRAIDACSYIQKQGWNQKQRYNYVREEDVMAAVRKALSDNKLVVLPTQVDISTEYIELTSQAGKQYKAYQTTVVMDFEIVDSETGESLPPRRFYGTSASPGDKQVYIATTNCQKYFMLKTLMIPTGDDAEAEPEPYEPRVSVQESTPKQVFPPDSRPGLSASVDADLELVEPERSNGSITASQEQGLRQILLGTGINPPDIAAYMEREYGVKRLRELNAEQAQNLMEECQEPDFRARVEGNPSTTTEPVTNTGSIETAEQVHAALKKCSGVKDVAALYMELREQYGGDHELTRIAQQAVKDSAATHREPSPSKPMDEVEF